MSAVYWLGVAIGAAHFKRVNQMTHASAHMYTAFKSKWSKAICGEWPSESNFTQAEKVFKAGHNNAMATAMALRAGGFTRPQMVAIMKPAFNDYSAAISAGYLKGITKPSVEGPTGRKVNVYKCSFIKARTKVTKAAGAVKGTPKAAGKGSTKRKAKRAPKGKK